MVWTLPDPVAALTAWCDAVRPGGRLVLLEGSWGGEGALVGAKDAVSHAVRRVVGGAEHHHGVYPPDVVAALPLSGTTSPAPFVDAVRAAGWQGVRLYRLRDVDWAVERREPWPPGLAGAATSLRRGGGARHRIGGHDQRPVGEIEGRPSSGQRVVLHDLPDAPRDVGARRARPARR